MQQRRAIDRWTNCASLCRRAGGNCVGLRARGACKKLATRTRQERANCQRSRSACAQQSRGADHQHATAWHPAVQPAAIHTHPRRFWQSICSTPHAFSVAPLRALSAARIALGRSQPGLQHTICVRSTAVQHGARAVHRRPAHPAQGDRSAAQVQGALEARQNPPRPLLRQPLQQGVSCAAVVCAARRRGEQRAHVTRRRRRRRRRSRTHTLTLT